MVAGRVETWQPDVVKAYECRTDDQAVPWLVRMALATGHQLADIAVLARTWRELESARDALEASGLPVRYMGKQTDPWPSDDGRALARALLLTRNRNDDNLASMLANWGAMDGPRVQDIRRLRERALLERCPLFDIMADELDAFDKVRKLFDDHTPKWTTPWSPSEWAEAWVGCLDVAGVYHERELATRLETIDICIAQLEDFATLEEFAAWWVERNVADRLKREGACPVCEGRGRCWNGETFVDPLGEIRSTGEQNTCPICQGTGRHQAVQLLTIHGAKGLEWPVVIGLGITRQAFQVEGESLRLLYVLVTRARDLLYLTRGMLAPTWGGRMKDTVRSPCLNTPAAPEIEDLPGA